MALAFQTVLEVRTTGSDLNGGGFVTGSGGTDYSLQDTPQYSFTDLVIDGTLNTKVTSASHSFAAPDVGNLINISAGTSWTLGIYQVVSVSGGAATLDRSPGATSLTGGTWALGGALASWGLAAAVAAVADMTVWIKAGTYVLTSNTYNVSGGPVQPTVRLYWRGYQTTRGDLGTPPLLSNSGSVVNKTLFDNSGNQACELVNLAVDANNVSGTHGWNVGPFGVSDRLRAYKAANNGFTLPQDSTLWRCYAEQCQYGFTNSFDGDVCIACVAKGCGIGFNGCSLVFECLSYGNSGDGFNNQGRGRYIRCSTYGNTRDGFNDASGQTVIIDCIAENCGRNGVSVNGWYTWLENFATFNCSSGAISGSPRFNRNPIAGTGSFFTNASAGDFTLNTTAGAGALLRGTGIPQALPVNLSASTPSIGATQPLTGGGGGGGGSPFAYALLG